MKYNSPCTGNQAVNWRNSLRQLVERDNHDEHWIVDNHGETNRQRIQLHNKAEQRSTLAWTLLDLSNYHKSNRIHCRYFPADFHDDPVPRYRRYILSLLSGVSPLRLRGQPTKIKISKLTLYPPWAFLRNGSINRLNKWESRKLNRNWHSNPGSPNGARNSARIFFNHNGYGRETIKLQFSRL